MKNRIKVLRAEHHLTQEDLAKRVLCTRQTINAIEKNKYSPSLELGFKIAEALHSNINEVFIYEKETL
jgi:putative transcriptional regulator